MLLVLECKCKAPQITPVDWPIYSFLETVQGKPTRVALEQSGQLQLKMLAAVSSGVSTSDSKQALWSYIFIHRQCPKQ